MRLRNRATKTQKRKSHGAGGVAVIMAMGALTLLLGVVWRTWFTPYFAEEQRVGDALARAVQALQGYCGVKGGKLPLPVDKEGQVVHNTGAGLYVGYLPYNELGLPRWSVMQSGGAPNEGELWYMVECADNPDNEGRCRVKEFFYRTSSNGEVLDSGNKAAVALVLHPGTLLAGQGRLGVGIGNFLEGANDADNPSRLLSPPGKINGNWKPVVTPFGLWRVAGEDMQWNDVGLPLPSCSSPPVAKITLNETGPNGLPVVQAFQSAGNGAQTVFSDPDPEVGNQPALQLQAAVGAAGGCLWFNPAAAGYPALLPLRGKSWRAYWSFRFDQADPVGGSDRGYGYTWLLVDGGSGLPNTCGLQQQMGVITTGSWQKNHFLEFDVYDQTSHNDPRQGTPLQGANHLALKHSGELRHLPSNGDGSALCHAGVGGNCPITTRDRWEETSPQRDRVRVEIEARCNSDCTQCTLAPNHPLLTHARWRVWLACDAHDCTDLTVPRSAAPAASACMPLFSELTHVYFGFTGGWTTGANRQGVKIWDFRLIIE